MFALSWVGTHPGLGSASMTLVSTRVNHKVAYNGVPGQRLNANLAAVLGQIADLGSVCEHDSSVDTHTGRRRTGSSTTTECKTAVKVPLHRDEQVLDRGVAGHSAGQRVPA